MQSTKIQIGEVKVNLRKKPYEPVVIAKISGELLEFSIADNIIQLRSGNPPSDIIERLKNCIAQYFLPAAGAKISKKKKQPQMNTQEIITALKEQKIDAKYFNEAVPIVINYMDRKECGLPEAVKFVTKWVDLIEKPDK